MTHELLAIVRRRRRRRRRVVAVAIAASLLTARFALAAPGAVPTDLAHRYVVDLTGTSRTASGAAVSNDLGITFEVSGATARLHSAESIVCDHSHGWLAEAVGTVLGAVPTAWAGHGGAGPTGIAPLVEVDLLASHPVDLGTVTLIEPAVCELNHVYGVVGKERAALDTLVLDATWAAPNGRTGTLAVRSDLAWGDTLGMVDVEGRPVEHLAAAGGLAELTIRPTLATLFDGIDPDAVTGTDLEMALLRNLTGGATITAAGTTHPA